MNGKKARSARRFAAQQLATHRLMQREQEAYVRRRLASEEVIAKRALDLHTGDPFVLHWVERRSAPGPKAIASFWPGRSDQ